MAKIPKTNQYMDQTPSQVIRLEERFNGFDEKLDKTISLLEQSCKTINSHETSIAVLNNKINTSNVVLGAIAVVGNMIAGYLGIKMK